ncbi:Wzz/FepE/Etk N-terminal domain-containing protein [Flavobacterium ginsenosidimutans]|uniref:Wzz/FepE/Etk N-terminal domain-containing protein n=1 Tax=Flavobacterium ginsenosidimutans TaxID=687844 RepID=A0ABZ2QAR3_9FLAO|nr:Wzz/FepE/Etk N-terminal domain-containing protein [Flavobacterium ginsenosidimutans]KAF2334156.1 lipopolysaccharide biosynthesis protein [Flavobacterium ginsenosidimutans]
MNKIAKESEEISMKEIFEQGKEWCYYLISKWKTLLIVGVLGAILGLTYSIIKKPIYTAELSFALEDDQNGGGIGGALGIASTLGLNLDNGGGGMFSGANLTELFKSRSMVEKTLLYPVNIDGKVITLAEMYIKNKDWRKKWEDYPKLKNLQFFPNSNREKFTRAQDSILGVIYKNISETDLTVGQKDKQAAIIKVAFISTDELFAKYFCETLAFQVKDFYIETKSKKARINMAILERQTDSIRNELNGAITGVAVASDNTFNLNPALNVRRAPSARRQVDVQSNTAILAELVKQTELAKITLRKDMPLIQVIDKPILPLQKKEIGKIKGIILGGFLFGFFAVAFLILKKIIT